MGVDEILDPIEFGIDFSKMTLGDIFSYTGQMVITYGECATIFEEEIMKRYQINTEIFDEIIDASSSLENYCHRLIAWEQLHQS